MCGDATCREDVGTLLGGRRPALTLADPPYGVRWGYEGTDDTEEHLAGLINGFLPIAREVGEVVLVTCGNKNQRLYPPPTWTLSWFCAAGLGRGPWGFTCWQPVLAYGKDPYLARGLGSRPDAVEFAGGDTDYDHPCPKPPGVWGWLMERGSVAEGDVVFDPFCGSGTTLAVAEQKGRRGYGLELEPQYVAVALERLVGMGLEVRLST